MINVNKFNNERDCNLTIPLFSNMSFDLNQDNIIGGKIDSKIDLALNKSIIDYEKIPISPIYYNNGEYKDVDYLIYDLDFLNQDGSFVNNWLYVFDKNDIKYQKEGVKNSFLRLLYYDNNQILYQNLFSMNTNFLNSNIMYRNYIYGKETFSKIIIPNNNIKNTFLSSESFQFLVFKTDFEIQEEETEYIRLYTKIEFNNAKNGKKYLFTPPLSDNYEITIKNLQNYLLLPINIIRKGSELFYYFVNENNSDISYSKNFISYDEETKSLIVKLKELKITYIT